MQQRRVAEIQWTQLREHLVDLRHIGAPRDGERHYLVVEQVHHRGQVSLPAGHFELRDIGGELRQRRVGVEVPVQYVPCGLAHFTSIRAVPLAPDPARAPSSRMSLSTVFPEMRRPCSILSAMATWR